MVICWIISFRLSRSGYWIILIWARKFGLNIRDKILNFFFNYLSPDCVFPYTFICKHLTLQIGRWFGTQHLMIYWNKACWGSQITPKNVSSMCLFNLKSIKGKNILLQICQCSVKKQIRIVYFEWTKLSTWNLEAAVKSNNNFLHKCLIEMFSFMSKHHFSIFRSESRVKIGYNEEALLLSSRSCHRMISSCLYFRDLLIC